jgi:hypothetical protein
MQLLVVELREDTACWAAEKEKFGKITLRV